MLDLDNHLLVVVQDSDFDVGKVLSQVAEINTNIGAVVSFTGLCRDEKGRLAALELEHYPGMAKGEIMRIAKIATTNWQLGHLIVIHRYGKIAPGGNIVLVVASSRHRRDAFEAASFMMDFLKTNAPFWKKEHLLDGSSGEWVSAAQKDDDAIARWKEILP